VRIRWQIRARCFDSLRVKPSTSTLCQIWHFVPVRWRRAGAGKDYRRIRLGGYFKSATNSECSISAGVNLRKPDFSNHRRIGATLTPELELRFKGFRVGFEVVFDIVNS
jgi:hypothetical protein